MTTYPNNITQGYKIPPRQSKSHQHTKVRPRHLLQDARDKNNEDVTTELPSSLTEGNLWLTTGQHHIWSLVGCCHRGNVSKIRDYCLIQGSVIEGFEGVWRGRMEVGWGRCGCWGRWIIMHFSELMNQNLRVRKSYSACWIFGGHVCSICCPLDKTAHRVTDKTKFRPTNFLLFSGYETPNGTITCTAWKHDGCQFWGDFGFWRLCFKINYQCVNILWFLNETLPLVIYYFVSHASSTPNAVTSWS